MEFSALIRQFAEKYGIQVPEIVDDAAAFDADGMPFFLMRVANEGESEYLVIAADLGEPPPERPEKLYQALLDAGHNFAGAGGGAFARNPADGHIWLQTREACAAIDIEVAISKVKALGDAACKLKLEPSKFSARDEMPVELLKCKIVDNANKLAADSGGRSPTRKSRA